MTPSDFRPHRRHALVLAAALAAMAVVPAQAEDPFPGKTIRMYLPYGAGGIGDTTGRVIAQKMSENLRQQIIIDNRPSAGGIQAFQAALQAPADGYTLVMGGNGTAISQSMFRHLPYDILTDFTQVAAMSKFSLAVLVKPQSKFRSLAELVAFAKANPGKLNFGTTSIGSTQHLSAELFKSVAGIEAQVVPFKTSAELYSGLRGADIDVAFEFLPPVLSSIKAGSLRALAIASDRRNANLPDVPTAAEGGVKGFEVNSWNAVSVKAGTPPAIVARLNLEFNKAIASPEVAQKLRDMNSEAWTLTPAQTRQLMASEIARWKAVIVRARIEPQ